MQKYLCSNPQFNEQFYCINLPRICDVTQIGEEAFKIAASNCDVCISQPISDNNRFSNKLSSNNLFSITPKGALNLLIPNCTFLGYFPQYKAEVDGMLSFGEKPIFAYSDKYIDGMICKGLGYQVICNEIQKENFISRDIIVNFYEEQLRVFKEREKDCQIKMYDFVEKNAKKEIFWYSFNHPKNIVIKQLAIRILNYLGINDVTFYDEDLLDGSFGLRGQMQPVYPCVCNELGIKFNPNMLYTVNYNSSQFRIDFSDYVRYYCNSKIQSKISIDIWGSCVSRELFNYTNLYKVNAYILQNPLHTLWAEPLLIPDDKIVGTSNFTKRMATLELQKKAVEYFNKNFNSDYLMIDTCDCRSDYYVVNNDPTICIAESTSITKILQGCNEENFVYERKSVFDITDEQWQGYVSKFVALIKSRYSEDHIIINEFNFAKSYIGLDGKIDNFSNRSLYEKQNMITTKVAQMLKEAMPNAKVISPIQEPLGDETHKLGLYPVHYSDNCYYLQVNKLNGLLGYESICDKE